MRAWPKASLHCRVRHRLNEGRGRDPGDTWHNDRPDATRRDAQRRPGPRPRRHEEIGHGAHWADWRSTKAGAETPATHENCFSAVGQLTALNEGRGRDPGDTDR